MRNGKLIHSVGKLCTVESCVRVLLSPCSCN